jgi:hypothetical protein
MGTTAVDWVDRKEARGRAPARFATLAGPLFTAVAAHLVSPRLNSRNARDPIRPGGI